MWQLIETAKPGTLLLYFPPEERNGKIVLSEMVRAEMYPVSYPRKPSHWMSIPPLPKVPARDYQKMFSENT